MIAASKINQLITEGKIQRAKRKLNEFAKTKQAKRYKYQMASFYRRLGHPEKAVKILNPIVRPERSFDSTANLNEKLEYAAACISLGLIQEGQTLLDQLPENLAAKQLYLAFSHIGRWNYEQASSCLKQYLKNTEISEYQRLIGQINLAACLVEQNKNTLSHSLLNKILKTSQKMNSMRIYANALELKAQLEYQRQPQHALKLLEKAESFLPANDSLDGFFILKWKKLALCYQNGSHTYRGQTIKNLIKRANQFDHYESLRQLDLHQVKLLGKTQLVSKLYYGTPYPKFKQSLKDEFSEYIQSCYYYQLGRRSKTIIRPLQYSFLNYGLIGKLFYCLLSDFYRPFSTIKLFNSLFPSEFYNPSTSKNKIYQLVNRLNHKFIQYEIPLEVKCQRGLYTLHSDKGCSVQVSSENDSSKEQKILGQLAALYAYEEFSLKQASFQLELPPRSLSRHLKEMIAKNLVKAIGSGRARKYALTSLQNE